MAIKSQKLPELDIGGRETCFLIFGFALSIVSLRPSSNLCFCAGAIILLCLPPPGDLVTDRGGDTAGGGGAEG